MASGGVHVGMPCHHPAWPRRCDACGERADGFTVGRPLGPGHRFAFTGMACPACRRAVLRRPDPGTSGPWGVDHRTIEAATRESPYFRYVPVAWLGGPDFDARCVLPAESVT